jgi:hypothetical protein
MSRPSKMPKRIEVDCQVEVLNESYSKPKYDRLRTTTTGTPGIYAYARGNPLTWSDRYGLAIGDFPPAPPGYNPLTWSQGNWPNGKDWLEDPQGNKFTAHKEDYGHWRHWDKRDNDNNDQGQCPPNSGKPRPGQKKLNENQSPVDPNGNAPPWAPMMPDTMVPFSPFDFLRFPRTEVPRTPSIEEFFEIFVPG